MGALRLSRARARALVAAAILGAASLAAPTAAFAQSWRPGPIPSSPASKEAIEEAREHYRRGLRLYSDGHIEGALVEMQRSYDRAPNYKVLYNLAKVARSMPDYATSLVAFERYLADGGAAVPKERRDEVQKEIDDLRSMVAELTITTDVEGASVSLDDAPLGTTPLLKPIVINPGRYKVTAVKEGASVSKVISVSGKDSAKVQLKLGAGASAKPAAGGTDPAGTEAKPDASSAPPPPVLAEGSGSIVPSEKPLLEKPLLEKPLPKKPRATGEVTEPGTSYTWIGWTVTGALVAAGAVTGVLAVTASDELKGMTYIGVEPSTEVKDVRNRVNRMAITTDVLAAAAAVSLGVTLLASFASPQRATRPGVSGSSATVRVMLGPSGVALDGRF